MDIGIGLPNAVPGTDIAKEIAAQATGTAETAQGYAAAFQAGGCDELIFIPATASPDQVRLLAEAVL